MRFSPHSGCERPRRRTAARLPGIGCAAAALVLTLVGAVPSTAIDIERMVMPGPLAKEHAKLEDDCSSCHQAFDVEAQRALCLACHEPVGEDLAKHVGFHGRSPLASVGQCRSCHPDHLGREADIRGAGESTFDHAQTDFPLRGRHENTPCIECHAEAKPRREAPIECFACHEEDDKHAGTLSQDCGKCHGEATWATTKFDHAKTDYPLTGAHASASCDGCHAAERYEGTPTDCVSCHAIDDKHAGRFGPDCADCHDTRGWKKQGFDHAKESGFPLTGAHATATCASCHREPPGKRKLPETCAACHGSDDIHAGRFGEDCKTCHASTKWADGRFDHGAKTDFALKGAHARASCNTCHASTVAKDQTPTDCFACHGRDDVHRGKLGRDCEDCHDSESFTHQVRFDHDLTGFPLLGLHASTACESCHSDQTFQRSNLACRSCHAADDVHKRTMGANCERCHNPNGWSHWKFDHDAETKFALHGAHADLECAGCHRTPITAGVQMPGKCIDCHAPDDAHRGGFGRTCNACHSDKAWKPATFGKQGRSKR